MGHIIYVSAWEETSRHRIENKGNLSPLPGTSFSETKGTINSWSEVKYDVTPLILPSPI